ncbi:serine protease [Burkholderia sp. Ax-1719]|uniref:S1 family peptidase n=1 Tax=Burkholderia sp. Ax-1719 TaxID=2608334 RepID=UPI00141EFD07|nr:serine protease [Burkholderia sp. Ax-1719]NIE63131.1 trypsin-like peptidase domain-containing protein [Burkholderia sp. Ax-1719]
MPQSWQEGALFNTTMIRAHSQAQGRRWTGTGFFVYWMGENGDNELFLVSNRHVLENNQTFQYGVLLHRKAPEGQGFELKNTKSSVWIDFNNPVSVNLDWIGNYFAPKDPEIDLACIRCTNLLERDDIVLAPLTQRAMLDWKASKLHPGQQVLFVGYPDSVHDRMHNLPVLRTGVLASLPYVDFDGKPDFLLDAQIWNGSSGSPVFVKADDAPVSFSLIGVIHSSRKKRDQTDTNIGLGYGVKSSELLKLLSAAATGAY